MYARFSIDESPDIGDRLPERRTMGRINDNVKRGFQTVGEALGRFFGRMTSDPHFREVRSAPHAVQACSVTMALFGLTFMALPPCD